MPALNWIMFDAGTAGYDVRYELDPGTVLKEDRSRRRSYRFQLQGP